MRNPIPSAANENRSGVVAAILVGLGIALSGCATAPTATAPPTDIVLDGTYVFPESMSAAPDGTMYVGSTKGLVYRAPAGSATAEPWITSSDANGILSVLGVLADERSNTLWICSSPMRAMPAKGGTSALMAFDLKTGAQKGVYPLPAPGAVCNDITIAKDGTAFATDTPNGRILTLAPGATALALFVEDPALKGIDGIVFDSDGTLYVNNVIKNQLLRVDRKPDGSFAALVPLTTSEPVGAPDGFRLIANHHFLLAEGSKGRIDEVTIDGDNASIRMLKDGLISPPGVTLIGRTAYALEGKIVYLMDPKLKGQDPGPFKVYAVPLDRAH